MTPVTVSDMTSPSFTQMFGVTAAMAGRDEPGRVAPDAPPEQPDQTTSTVPSTTIE